MTHTSLLSFSAILPLAALLCACDSLSLTYDILSERVPIGTPRAEKYPVSSFPPQRSAPDTAVWALAVEYPEGYDWRADTLKGEVQVALTLFRNGKRHLRVEEKMARVPPHILLNGSLYCFIPRDGRTGITKDNTLVMSLDGEHMIRGFREGDGDIWCLGADKNGEGITLWQNGKEVFRQEGATIAGGLCDEPGIGALREDENNLHFFFKTRIADSEVWSIWINGKTMQIPSSGGRILDAIFRGGKVHTIARSEKTGLLCVSDGTKSRTIISSLWAAGEDASFVKSHTSEICIRAEGIMSGKTPSSIIWIDGQIISFLPPYTSVFSDGKRMIRISQNQYGTSADIPWARGPLRFDGFFLSGPAGVYFPPAPSAPIIALSAREEQLASFLTTGEETLYSLNINGYLTAVDVTINNNIYKE